MLNPVTDFVKRGALSVCAQVKPRHTDMVTVGEWVQMSTFKGM